MRVTATVRRTRTRTIGALSVIVVVLIGAGCSTSTAAIRLAVHPPSGSPIQVFLERYVQPDGRVVRLDQGGDTVSEGQAYAMLLAIADNNRGVFTHVWAWSEQNLAEPDGLLASSWDGSIVDPHSASDADLDVARALLLGGTKWRADALTTAGRRYAAAILANETVDVRGRTVLVAGPWATSVPYWVDPSYFDPATYALLAAQTGNGKWASIASSSEAILGEVTDGGRQLPPDWAQVDAAGNATPSGPPAGGDPTYGYDAFRVIIRQAETCSGAAGRTLVSELAPLVRKTASPRDEGDTYALDGKVASAGDNPLTLVAAAAASGGATRQHFLDEAEAAARAHPTYFLDAWVALGPVLINPSALERCSS